MSLLIKGGGVVSLLIKPKLEDIKSSKGFAIVEDEKYGLVVKAPSDPKYQITPKENSDK